MADYSATSQAEWHPNGAFTLGFETVFSGGNPDVADKTQDIPISIIKPIPPVGVNVVIFWGNVSYRPKQNSGASDCLVRVWIIGDGGPDQGYQVVNCILKTIGQPASFSLPPIYGSFPPPPQDGSPYQLRVRMEAAGADWPTDCEIQLCGRWS